MNSEEKRFKFWKQISSELRSPLSVIKGVSEISKSEIYDIDDVKEGLGKIEECSDVLLNIVNNIVDYTAIDNEEFKLQNVEFSLKDLINRLTVECYAQLRKRNKHFNVQIHDVSEEMLAGDEKRVEQILKCMFRNAGKYTIENGMLNFHICQTEEKNGKIQMRFLMICSGREVYDKMNETVNGNIVNEVTDLELFNCHYFLEQMGGTIGVYLTGSSQSEVRITMQFDKVESEKPPQKMAYFEKERILIVCDSEKEAEERGEFLKEMHISYDIACEKEEVLGRIGEAEESGTPYCMCIIDWNIQKYSLQGFVNEIHNIFGKRFLIVATAFDTEEVLPDANKFGINYVIGKAWFRSTIFDLLMEIKHGKHEENEQKQEMSYDFAGRNVLIAEDADLNMEIMVKMMTKVNASVVCASNGEEAVMVYEKKPEGFFDCILMDVNMPEMDGYEATRRIRNSKKSDAKTVPIYALTANAFYADIREALNAGMDGHFSKPVDVTNLYATLNKIFAEDGKINYSYRDRIRELEQENKMLLQRAENDPLTGLLNRYGFEKKIHSLQLAKRPVGLLMLDIDNFKNINDMHGHDVGDRTLIKLADALRMKFRTSDLIVRFGGDEFSVVLNNYTGNEDFVVRKIDEINEYLMNPEGNFPKFSISAGAAFSLNGYTKELCEKADQALYHVKRTGKGSCYVMSTDEEEDTELSIESIWNASAYGTDMYFMQSDNGVLMERKDDYFKLILGKNQAIGIVCGFFEEGLPVYSISGFALENLGYDFDSFQREAGGLLSKLVYEDDFEILKELEQDSDLDTRKIRMVSRKGDVLWFSLTYLNSKTTDGRKVWILSLRPVDDSIVGLLCNMDYATVSLIFCKDHSIMLEKGTEYAYKAKLKRRKKYNYESLLRSALVVMHKKEDVEEYLKNTSISHIVEQLDRKNIYEFIAYQISENGESLPIRYKYRYLNGEKDVILWTQEYVENFAEMDDITSLLNQNGFIRKAGKILKEEKNLEKRFAILLFDIKNFKSWNEILGKANGDELLKKASEWLAAEIANEAAARISTDHYAFLVDYDSLDYAAVSSACHKQTVIAGNRIRVRMHCGIYRIDDINQGVEVMLNKAIIAEESVKNEFAAPYCIYDSEIDTRYQNQIFVMNNLERAFSHDEFRIYYQPVYDTKTRKIASAEALVRWQRVGGKMIAPGVFIPVMEEKGYISQLDFIMAKGVQEFLEKRKREQKICVPVSMNLSRMDFLNERFMTNLDKLVKGTELNHDYLCYEVTESAFVGVGDGGNALLDTLRKAGSKIYIDDFGTGYSSLQNLLEMEFDVLKLDMAFIRKIGISRMAENIITSAIKISHDLNTKVIAEGVETEEQYRFLLANDCDYIQGYYFSKPVPEEDFVKMLDAKK